jgi:rSAM/selenodomain-associated transferase 1
MTSSLIDENCLIIFTRYPEVGTTKTRMIPVMGAEKAASLQRKMTEHTIQTNTLLSDQFPVKIMIFYTGGNLSLIKNWLGNQYDYVNQGSGDLGERLKSAFETVFEQGKGKVVIIGTDCPDITPIILKQGFDALNNHDLVLGPAKDGGYYLIGIKCLISELFQGISWGTETVFAETIKIGTQLGLKTAFLPELTDIDRPEDLPIWQKYCKL